ncbi:hypothetical protein BXY51_009105 [Actinoplanes cyaneus]|nr:hypothetical protein [Actinoplanes cyaneus]
MLTFLDQGGELADLSTSGLRDQASWEPLQLRKQDRDLALIENRVEIGTEPGEHRKRCGIEADELLSPLEATRPRLDLAGLSAYLEIDHRTTITAPDPRKINHGVRAGAEK